MGSAVAADAAFAASFEAAHCLAKSAIDGPDGGFGGDHPETANLFSGPEFDWDHPAKSGVDFVSTSKEDLGNINGSEGVTKAPINMTLMVLIIAFSLSLVSLLISCSTTVLERTLELSNARQCARFLTREVESFFSGDG
mmetsp:Transcript_25304/g.69887  ORF Transcript_25304/g.69887 Transcript_25304/m.69887 type:complete len:139 (-) Transcript_25304:32-448(-)